MKISHILLVVSLLSLAGCQEESRQSPLIQATTDIEPDEAMTFVPKVEREPEPVVIKEVIPEPEVEYLEIEFSKSAALERAEKVNQLRALRRESYQQQVKASQPFPEQPTPPADWDMQDPDFQRWGKHPVDTSTYPTDTSRMVLETQRITAVLEDEVNSQIGGRAIAVVDKDVPSADFSHVAIPMGSKMVCSYQPLEKVGETRLDFECERIITPQHVSVYLSNKPKGTDQKGRTGLIGEVDNRTFQRFGSAFTVSTIGALSQVGAGRNETPTHLQQFGQNFGNQVTQITQKLLDNAIDLSPSITIKGGAQIQLRPHADIYFRKPVAIRGDDS